MSNFFIGSIIGIAIGIIGIYFVDEQFELFATILILSFSAMEFSQAKYYFDKGNKTRCILCTLLGIWVLILYLFFVGMYVLFDVN